ncbi:MAG: putative membrane protein [Kiritimatiellia bacterium]|jgi:putative membrane protein
MMDIPVLATVNASLNALAGVLLFFGRRAIKQGKPETHKKIMLGAFGVSAVFLACYLTYHYTHGSTRYTGTGALKALYLLILIPHVILATGMVPFILSALYFALKQRFETHKRIVKWVWPVWMYVSVTGVLVYLMLYIFPTNAG